MEIAVSIASGDKPARLSLALPVILLLAGVTATWGIIAWQLHADERRMRAEGEAAAVKAATSHAAYVEDLIDQGDQLLVAIRHMRRNGSTADQIERMMEDLPSRSWMNPLYADADGVIRSVRSASVRGSQIREQSFFLAHDSDTSPDLKIHEAARGLGALSEQTVIRLTRRVDLPSGGFGGVASLAIPTELLTQPRGVHNAATGIVLIGTRDGTLLTSSTRAGASMYRTAGDKLAGVVAGESSVASALGMLQRGGHHFHATKALTHHPLQVVVALDKRIALAPLHTEKWQMVTLGSMVTLIILSMSGWTIWRQVVRANAEERARQMRQVFRRAVDDSKDEFYILSPMHNPAGVLADFRIADCNAQATRAFMRPREALVGQSLQSLLPPVNWRATRDYLVEAMTDGFAEKEAFFHRDDDGQKRWMHCRATLVADDLAVTLRDVTEAKDNQRQLQQLALTDGLTGLPNRHWVNEQLAAVLRKAAHAKECVAALFIDLDNFKTINDTLGHQAGDDYLREAATVLREGVRKNDIVVRLGGDEFLVLILHLDDLQRVNRVADDIVGRIRELGHKDRWSSANPRASVGIAIFPIDARSADDLVQAADIAMYEAKRLGKDRFALYVPSMRERLRDEFGLESALRRAVAEDQLSVVFQPRASALTGQLLGFEALARWEHPVLGQIPPARFIPMAEKHNLIDDIGCWVIEEVCRTIVQWRAADNLLHPVSVNISARQLKTPRLRHHLTECTRRYRIPASQIELELTESMTVGTDPAVRRELKLLSEMGHKLMIDDFGTGYSSLAQLQHLKVDVLKIDASFVHDLSSNDETGLICKAMVQIGKTLGIDVVAEGVETREQLEQLQQLGCDEVQGYLLAEPMPADKAMLLLDHRTLFSANPL